MILIVAGRMGVGLASDENYTRHVREITWTFSESLILNLNADSSEASLFVVIVRLNRA